MSKPAPAWAHLRNVIANVQVSLSLAAYTKVTPKWRQYDFIPDFCRFYYVLEGEGGLVIDGKTYSPQPGQLFVMPSGVKMSYYAFDDREPFGKYWCHFTAKVGERDLFRLLGLPAFIDVEDQVRMTGLFEQLRVQYESDGFTAVLHQKAILLEIIGLFLEGAAHRGAARIPAEQIKIYHLQTVLRHIEAHLHEPISVAELAELVHFHPNYFIRYFHELMGVPPLQYINNWKMEKAMELLLADPGMAVSEVARAVGMELYYFSRLFRKHAGLSPTGYRELFGKT